MRSDAAIGCGAVRCVAVCVGVLDAVVVVVEFLVEARCAGLIPFVAVCAVGVALVRGAAACPLMTAAAAAAAAAANNGEDTRWGEEEREEQDASPSR